jgi:hypothetical protein
MLEKLTHYRSALYLSIAVALANCVIWGVIVPYRLGDVSSGDIAFWCIVSLLIPFGLWLQSVLIGSAGALFMVLVAGTLIWPLLSSGFAAASHQPLLVVFYVIAAALNLLTAGVLFSKKFRSEFIEERKRQPAYKRYLKWSVLIAVIGASVIGTFIDIVNLASTP